MWTKFCLLTCIIKLCACTGNILRYVQTDCSNGAYILEGSCFKYVATNKTWSDANKFCHDMYGGHLAIPDSVAIFNRMKSVVKEHKLNYMWLGAHDRNNNSVYNWVDGRPCCPHFWVPGQPDNGGGAQHCLGLWPVNDTMIGFDDGGCGTKASFVCQTKGCQSIPHCISTTCLGDIPSTCNACENGYIPVKNQSYCFDLTASIHLKCFTSCHVVFTQGLSWNDAKNVCKSRGGHLYIPENSDEDEFLKTYLEAVVGTFENFWVGGQLLKNLKEQWLSHVPLAHMRFGNFSTSLTEDRCFAFRRKDRYHLGAFTCDNTFPFVCQERSLYFPSPVG